MSSIKINPGSFLGGTLAKDLNLNGYDIAMSTGLIGYSGTAAKGLSFDSGNEKVKLESGQFIVPDGTKTLPSLAPTSNQDTGIYFSAEAIGLSVNDTEAIKITQGASKLEIYLSGKIKVKTTDVNAATYTMLESDYYIHCRRTSTGVCSITLPAISTVGGGSIYIIKDSGYNSAANNITVARTGTDKINNVSGNYTINVSGSAISFIANATTNDWEIF